MRNPFSQIWRHFHPHALPLMTRPSYARELVTSLTMPVAGSFIEGAVIGVLAKKAFDVPPILFAVIMASPMFANLTSFMWARLARGMKKVPVMTMLFLGVLACVGSVALLPRTEAGAVMLTGIVVVSRMLLAGIITLRSTLWRANYPRHLRASVTGRFTLVTALIMAIAPVVGYALLDRNPEAFRVIYPAAVLVGLGGVWAFSGVRFRGERELLRFESTPTAKPTPHGEPAPIYEYDPQASDDTFWSVLRRDKFYRRYLGCQFIAGSANMMSETVIIYIIADLTVGMSYEYTLSIAMGTVIPMLMAMISLPVWARMLDRMHIAHFRSRQSWLWVGDQAMNWIGAATGSLWLIAAARVVQGTVRGGGMLAWQLGHNDFADRKLVAIYMGIHQTLTGVRGAIAPFLAMLLFTATEQGGAGLGPNFFVVSFTLALLGATGFTLLSRSMGNAVRADR